MQEDAATTLRDDGGWPDVDASGQPPRSYPKWPFVLAGILLAIGIAIAAVWPIKLAYYTLSPGPIYDTSDFVSVADGIRDDSGELFFLTVSLKEANVFEYVGAWLDPAVDLSPRENIRPPDVSPEQLRRENLALMNESKTNATFVALTQLGYEPVYIGTGALVIEAVPDSAADGVLLASDIIVEIDGQLIAFRSDVIDLLAGKQIGDEVRLVVERVPEEGSEAKTVELTVVLGPHTDDPERPMIGILLDNNEPIIEFPVDVAIDSQNIGGPSAGMMFTLQIIDQLTEDALTRGHRIAGTGSIDRDGTVGAIGGVKQKVHAAIDAGAYAVMVPEANYPDAVEAAAGDDILVVSISTIEDALAFLETLPT
jgi:PDZ domain-containing protein